MKRLLLIAALVAALVLPAELWAAGSCSQALTRIGYQGNVKVVKFLCTGDASDGSIPNTAIATANMTEVKGMYLYTVSAYPTSGGTAPDAADVFILDAAGEDLLGSADGGTTANKGANLIHATLKKTTLPYSYYLSQAYFPAVTSGLTLKVSNQATHSANYTIEMVFAR